MTNPLDNIHRLPARPAALEHYSWTNRAFRARMHGIALFGLAALALTGCSKNPSAVGTGTVNMRMTDAPGDFESVNLVVREVAVHFAGAGNDSTSGWEVLKSDSAVYNLLALRNGVFANIGTSRVRAGHYTQVRLKLGTGSNVVIGGVTYPLTVPSGLQSGYKLVGSFDVPADGLVDIALDFDAARSIILTGAGNYLLKPAARVVLFSTAGAIRGAVAPAGAQCSIYAIQGPDTLSSADAADDGTFQVSVLPAGTYSLALHPATGYRDTTLTGVAVTAGATTNVGTVALTAQ